MKTILKWPGGKEKELPVIRENMPEYSGRFVEPFVGGGAVYFDVDNPNCCINDKSEELINLYNCIKRKNADFVKYLQLENDEFTKIGDFVDQNHKSILELYHNKISVLDFLSQNESVFLSIAEDYHSVFVKELIRNLSNKIKRSHKLESEQGSIPDDDRISNIEAALKSAYYMYIRHLQNIQSEFSDGRRAAIFFFVREYCYSSMFRYNAKGEFNVPYGKLKTVYLCDTDYTECPFCDTVLSSCKSAVLIGFDRYVELNGAICKGCLKYYLESDKSIINLLRRSYDPIYLDGSFLRDPEKFSDYVSKTVGLSQKPDLEKNILTEQIAPPKPKIVFDPNDFTKWNEQECRTHREYPQDVTRRTETIELVIKRITHCPKCNSSLKTHMFPFPLKDKKGYVIELKGLLCPNCDKFYLYKTLRVMNVLKRTSYNDTIEYISIPQNSPFNSGIGGGGSFTLGDEFNEPNQNLNPSNSAYDPTLYGKKRRPGPQSGGRPHSELNTEKPLKWWN